MYVVLDMKISNNCALTSNTYNRRPDAVCERVSACVEKSKVILLGLIQHLECNKFDESVVDSITLLFMTLLKSLHREVLLVRERVVKIY